MHHSTTKFAASLALAVVTSAAHAQANLPSGPARGAASKSSSARPADNSLPPDSVLVRSLVFRSIGPAVMSGRISDLAVTDNARSPRGRIGKCDLRRNRDRRRVEIDQRRRHVGAGLRFRSHRLGRCGRRRAVESRHRVGRDRRSEQHAQLVVGHRRLQVDRRRKTWSAAMLPKSQHIGKIVIDPRDPNVVYVAALGPLWASGGERGLYKTTDGGKTWTNTKEISKYTGFGEIAMDPSNPDVLYAASQMRERREYGFLPAGPESAIYKTIDARQDVDAAQAGLAHRRHRPHRHERLQIASEHRLRDGPRSSRRRTACIEATTPARRGDWSTIRTARRGTTAR